jgi:Fic family protein
VKNFQSGYYVQQGYYKSFQPSEIDRVWLLDNMELIQLLGRADRELGRLDMYSEYIPNIDLFISMHVLKEATQSSKIEGTQTNMAEALLNREDVAPENRDDWEEVQNYVAAMKEAIANLEKLPSRWEWASGEVADYIVFSRSRHIEAASTVFIRLLRA